MSFINNFHSLSQAFKLLLLAILVGSDFIHIKCLNFNYPIFYKEDRKNFIFANHSDIIYDAIQVTSDVRGKSIMNLSGRVLYQKKLKLWSSKKNITSSFNSTFVLNISKQTDSGGEGLAFILSKDSEVPHNSQGQWLGIVNTSTNGTSLTKIIAIEFDTKKSYSEDLDDNHVGLNVNSVYSIKQVSLNENGIYLPGGANVTAIIQYDGMLRKLNVFVFLANETRRNTKDPIISIDLSVADILPEDVFVGFSASTGERTQLNCITSWYFSSSDINENSDNLLWLWIIIPVISIMLLGVFAYCIYRKTGSQKVEEQQEEEDKYPGLEQEIQLSAQAPQKYQLKELILATDNFHPKNKLGEGGFGKVYKGFLDNKEIAVKRISKESRQGKQEFLAEVKTIGGLHHKNLVKLVGWCYESNELLLVYEFMPNGSLEKLIFGYEKGISSTEITVLRWEMRQNIICGIGQALDYLHNGCEKRVLHRDIKASNIMLDSEFNARLGDFGLARTIQLSEKTHHSTKEIAGTPGYIAPEFFHTSRASAETDVYAFGILLLEVASGRKPGNQNEQNKYINGIVEWVWELYRREKIMDAMDVRLDGKYQKDEAERVLMLGLACCHPNPYERPLMRTVLQVLIGEADPPEVPIEKPVFMWPASPLSYFLDSDVSLNGSQLIPFSKLRGR